MRRPWLTLPAGEEAVPVIGGLSAGVSVHSKTQGDYVFKDQWGKWFSAEEIKAGKVAEHLAALKKPTRLVDHQCKHKSAEVARRWICILFPSMEPTHLVADTVGNRLIYTGPDLHVAQDLKRILQEWDQPAEVPLGDAVLSQMNEMQSELSTLQKSQSPDRVRITRLESNLATMERVIRNGVWSYGVDSEDRRVPETVKVIQLKHAQATDVTDVLKQLYDQGPAKIASDPRTNSVIVSGPENQLQEIEALLLKLDEAGTVPPQVKHFEINPEADKLIAQLEDEQNTLLQTVGPAHPKMKEIDARLSQARSRRLLPSVTAAPDDLPQLIAQSRSDYTADDAKAHRLAEQLRQPGSTASRDELRLMVARAFADRQNLLRAELLEMQTKLAQTQQSLDLRDRISDQIIQRRVEDLLNPQLEWGGTAGPSGQPLTQTKDGSPGESPTPDAPRQIPAGMRVVTVKLDDPTLAQVQSLVRPGDKVDLLVREMSGGLPETLLEFVEVYAVDSTAPVKNAENRSIQHVSLLVTQEMMQAVLRAREGRWLSLTPRSPQDAATPKLNAAAIENLMKPTEFHAAMLAKLQGVWEAEFSGPGTTADGKKYTRTAETQIGGVVEIRNDKLLILDSGDASVDKVKEVGYFKLQSIKRDQPGKPLQVEVYYVAKNDPDPKEMPGIIEITDNRVRICFDESTRPTVFEVGSAHATWMYTLKRPAPQSPTHLGVRLAPEPVSAETLPKDFRGGLLIQQVYANTPAALGGMKAGDILLGFSAYEMTTPENLQFALSQELTGEIFFNVLREGIVRSGYVLLDGSKRPEEDAGRSPDELTKISVEYQRGHSVPTQPAAAIAPTPEQFHTTMLAKLQGAWNFEGKAINKDFGGVEGTPVDVEFDIKADLLTFKYTLPDGTRLEHPAQLKLGEAGPPQQIDVIAFPNDAQDRHTSLGIIEIKDDVVRICLDNSSDSKRPEVFAVSPHVLIWELRRKPEVTELEGDWHLVSSTDHEGKVTVWPMNHTYRGDRHTMTHSSGHFERRVVVNPQEKSIQTYKLDDDSGFFLDHYELKGNQLITRDDQKGEKVYERGHVRIPKTIPRASEEQMLRWRSGIVEIIGVSKTGSDSGSTRPLGHGTVVTSGGVIISQVPAHGKDAYTYRAKFDDGSLIPLKVVETKSVEDASHSWMVFEPAQPIEINHHFQISRETVELGDQVYLWGRSGSSSRAIRLDCLNSRVSVLDRKYPALGVPVWQLDYYMNPEVGAPILDAEGNMLAMLLVGTGDLLLAIPVAQLREMFPKTFAVSEEPAAEPPQEEKPVPAP